RRWGAFAVGDLFLLNLLTIVTEFIGVRLALGSSGCSRYVSVPVAAVALVALTASGSFRRWERAMYALIAVNLVRIPLVVLSRPHGSGAGGAVLPSLNGGLDATLVLFVIALVG